MTVLAIKLEHSFQICCSASESPENCRDHPAATRTGRSSGNPGSYLTLGRELPMNVSRSAFAALAGSFITLGIVQRKSVAAASGTQLNAVMYGSKLGIKGPDGLPHDIMIPSNFVLKVGKPVTLTVENYDEGPHSITVPDLNLNLVLKAGKEQADKSVIPV